MWSISLFISIIYLNFGLSSVKPGVFIINGNDGNIKDFPYLVHISYQGKQHCGGSIINERVILSAAHCLALIDKNDLLVHPGVTDVSKPGVVHKVLHVIYHRDFNSMTIQNDIGLIILEKPLEFSDAIEPIELPLTNEEFEIGTPAVVSGWGLVVDGGNSSKILQYGNVEIFDHKVCNAMNHNKVTDNMICAASNASGSNSCTGDSGGPLVINNENVPKQGGIVSFGYSCNPGFPTVYTKVSAYVSWITENIVNLRKEKNV